MASLHDTALGDSGAFATSQATSDALAATVGELVCVMMRWEETTGAACLSVTDNASGGSNVYRRASAQTTLSAAISSTSATSISVASASGFPGSGNYYAQIDNEIVLVTAGQGTTTWTVSRGQLGTTAATHSSGATVSHANLIEQSGGYVSGELWLAIAKATENLTITATLTAQKKYLSVRALSFAPTGGGSWPANPVDKVASAQAVSTSISSGSVTAASSARLAVALMGNNSSRALTLGSGWVRPAEFADGKIQAPYKTLSGGESVVADATFTGTNEWVAMLVTFNESPSADGDVIAATSRLVNGLSNGLYGNWR